MRLITNITILSPARYQPAYTLIDFHLAVQNEMIEKLKYPFDNKLIFGKKKKQASKRKFLRKARKACKKNHKIRQTMHLLRSTRNPPPRFFQQF
jgi:hypothetical protein